MNENIETIFKNIGGNFLTRPEIIVNKLKNIKCLLFDWDGVFNTGTKSIGHSSTFSETDSMGINLLRFSFFLKTNEIPYTSIITGMHNESAFELAKRENFNAVYFNFKLKNEALAHIIKQTGKNKRQILFVYDDILDLSVAKKTGLSFMIKRPSSPLLSKYVAENNLADYITAHTADRHAVREICEMILGLKNQYYEVISHRFAFSDEYKQFINARNQITSFFFHKADNKIIETVI